jgi:PAS domain S-box-containing protein
MRKSSISPVRPYIVALALVVAATLLTHRLRPWIEEAVIFLPAFTAIVIGAWYGGLGPGLVATVTSALLCEFSLFEPYRSFSATASPARLGLFLLVGGLIAALAAARSRAADVERERRRWHEGILSTIADAVIASDHEGRVSFLNAAAESLVGWQRLEAPGRPLTEVFVAADGGTAVPMEHLARRLLSEDTVGDLTGPALLHARDGMTTPIESRFAPIRDEAGVLLGIAVIFRDIAERRRSEESMARLAALVETSNDAIIIWTLEGRVATWNPGAERMYGYSAAEALGQPSFLLVPPEREDVFHEVLARIEQGERLEHFETVRLRKDGSRVEVSVTMSPVRGADGALVGISSIARDISERRQAEEELRRARDDLELRVQQRTVELMEANAALEAEIARRERAEAARTELWRQLVTAEEQERSRLARELHDQMGQHLTALMLGLKALEDNWRGATGVPERLKRSHDLAGRIGQDVHRIAWELRPTALDDLGLRAALANYAEEWSKLCDVAVQFRVVGLDSQRLPSTIESTIYRIVQEALTNVLKHAEARVVNLVLGLRDHHVFAIVEDDGRGFEPRGLDAGPDMVRSLGVLGMRERLALVGGKLEIDSAPGEGSVIIASIPLHTSEATPSHGEEANSSGR